MRFPPLRPIGMTERSPYRQCRTVNLLLDVQPPAMALCGILFPGMMRIATPSHLSRWRLCPVLLVLMLSVIVLPALTMRFHSDDRIFAHRGLSTVWPEPINCCNIGWRMASNEFSGLTTKLLAVRPAVAPDATVYILGIKHSLHGFPVANNGLAGGLWAGGYDRSISIMSNFAGVSSGESALLSAVKRCPTQAPYPSSARRVFVVKSGDPRVLEIGGACPLEPIRADLLRRPGAWHVYRSDSQSLFLNRAYEAVNCLSL